MKITSYEEFNKLVAQSLGWETSLGYVEQGDLINDSEINYCLEVEYYHPSNLDEIGKLIYFREHGVAPNFSYNWLAVDKFLLPECDRRNLGIEWRRSPQSIVCAIAALTERYYPSVIVYTGADFKYPRSMNLATCLAWLRFNSVAFSWEIKVNQ